MLTTLAKGGREYFKKKGKPKKKKKKRKNEKNEGGEESVNLVRPGRLSNLTTGRQK